MLYGNYCYIFIENFPQKFSPCTWENNKADVKPINELWIFRSTQCRARIYLQVLSFSIFQVASNAESLVEPGEMRVRFVRSIYPRAREHEINIMPYVEQCCGNRGTRHRSFCSAFHFPLCLLASFSYYLQNASFRLSQRMQIHTRKWSPISIERNRSNRRFRLRFHEAPRFWIHVVQYNPRVCTMYVYTIYHFSIQLRRYSSGPQIVQVESSLTLTLSLSLSLSGS